MAQYACARGRARALTEKAGDVVEHAAVVVAIERAGKSGRPVRILAVAVEPGQQRRQGA